MPTFNDMKQVMEPICNLVDRVLARHHLTAYVVGGRITKRGLVLYLSNNAKVSDAVCEVICHLLAAQAVRHSVGQLFIQRTYDEGQTAVVVGDKTAVDKASYTTRRRGQVTAVSQTSHPATFEGTPTRKTAVSPPKGATTP